MSAQPDEIERRPVHGAAASDGEPLPEVQQMMVEKIRRGFSLYECAPLAGVRYQTAYGWCSRYPAFGKAVAEAAAEYEERLLKPVNRLIDLGAEDDAWVEPAAKMGLQVLSRRFPGWHEKHQIQQDVEVHTDAERDPAERAAEWSTADRIRAVYEMYHELGLDQLAGTEKAAVEPAAVEQHERPSTELVVQQRHDPQAARHDGCDHVGLQHNRHVCAKCGAASSVPFKLWAAR